MKYKLEQEDLHRDGGQSAEDGDTSDGEEAIPNALHGDPVVDVESHAEGEHVFDELLGQLLVISEPFQAIL